MKLNNYKYECKSALDFCTELESNSVKLIVTSPPYNLGKEYETRVSIKEYLKKFIPLIKEFYRILDKDGSICWQTGNFVNNGEVYPLDIFFYPYFQSAGFHLRNRIIWHFGHGLHCSKRFSGRYETILWFSKTDKYIFNLDNVRISSKYPGKRHFKGNKKGQISGNPKGKNPEDIWEMTFERLVDDWDALIWDIPNVKSNHLEKTDHPCQFPVELAERCVLALTNENDLVYDPFAGVASSLIAALKNNRKAYGTELEEKYINIGLQRIQNLADGKLLTRPIYKKIEEPNPKSKVAQRPKEWG